MQFCSGLKFFNKSLYLNIEGFRQTIRGKQEKLLEIVLLKRYLVPTNVIFLLVLINEKINGIT